MIPSIPRPVILAAGRSTRFGGNRPKCLAEVAGKPLLLHSLEALARAGFTAATIVVGNHGAEIRDRLASDRPRLTTSLIWNEDNRRPSIHSFHCAYPEMTSGALLIESDLIYDHRIVDALIDHAKPNAVCVTPRRNAKPFYVQTDENGRVERWGYDLTTDRELVGIYKLSRDAVEEMMGLKDVEYWDPMLSLKDGLFCRECDFMWNEVDTLDELEDARRNWSA